MRIEFDRLGRGGQPFALEMPDSHDADLIAERIWQWIRREHLLASRGFEVAVLDDGRVDVTAGFHLVGVGRIVGGWPVRMTDGA